MTPSERIAARIREEILAGRVDLDVIDFAEWLRNHPDATLDLGGPGIEGLPDKETK